MSGSIDSRPSTRVTWAFLLAEWVLASLFHELDVRCLQTQALLSLRCPRPRPLYDDIARLVLDVPWQRRTFLVLPAPYTVLVDLDFQAVGRYGTAQSLVPVQCVFPFPDKIAFVRTGFEHQVYATALASVICCWLKDDPCALDC